MPKNLPQSLTNFFLRLTIPKEDIIAIIMQAFEVPGSKKLSFIFDIDVFKLVDSHEDIWQIFNRLRDFKNEIFLNTITDKTKELFK